jgi:spermidine synthase
MVRTVLIGAAMNLTAAAGGFYLASRRPGIEIETAAQGPRKKDSVPVDPPKQTSPAQAVAAGALFISGFVSLACQVAWTRVFAMVLGPTIYAFSTMLVAFVGGIAIGASAGVRLAGRGNAIDKLAWCLLIAAAGTSVGTSAVDRLPLLVGEWITAPGTSFNTLIATEALLTAAMLLPTTVALGAAFPLALALVVDRRGAAGAGYLYAVNTAGAIAGSLVAGFALIPILGLRGTLLAAAGFAGAAAVGVALRAASRPRLALTAGAAAAVAVSIAAAPRWNDALLSSGAYKYSGGVKGLSLRDALEAGSLIYYREGSAGTVSVRRSAGTLSLAIDGKVDASTGGDMLTQKLLAHLPLLMHPAPRRTAVIGLGSGITAGAALTHPIGHLEVIEISPQVVEASRLFDTSSGRPLADPRTRLIVGDARTHLAFQRASEPGYDVLISEPSNPWMAGVAALFTREFFAAAAARLAPGGIMCQWAHTYDISDRDLRSIVATFATVFPDTTMWLVGDADLLLIGRPGSAAEPGAAIRSGFARTSAAADAATVGAISPFTLMSLFVGDSKAAAAYAGAAAVETDDRLRLEFSGPRNIVEGAASDNAARLRAVTEAGVVPPAIAAALNRATPADWSARGAMLLEASPRQAFEDFSRAALAGDDHALSGVRRAAAPADRIADGLTLMRRLADDRASTPTASIELSKLLAAAGDTAGAIDAAKRAADRFPEDVRPYQQLVGILADAGDADAVNGVLDDLRRLDPAGSETRYYTAVVAFMRGDLSTAAREGEAVLSMDQRHARAHNLLGAARASLGDAAGAQRAFSQAIAADPRDPSPYVNLGRLQLERADLDAAVATFSEALSVQPASIDAREGLASALQLRGEADRAARVRGR